MCMQSVIKRLLLAIVLGCFVAIAQAEPSEVAATETTQETNIDRIQLVSQQINLLKNRLDQSERELAALEKAKDKEISRAVFEKASKKFLDKASLDIIVAKSNLDSVNIELADSQQTISWLQKGIQEIESQLNVLSVFGVKIAKHEIANIHDLKTDLRYQKKLLLLEKNRLVYLRQLQSVAKNLLGLKKDRFNHLNVMAKSRNMLYLKQQQMRDELAYQEQQTKWLRQLNELNIALAKVDPSKSQDAYTALERDIFYTNENANYAYLQSLAARYTDQIQQMKLAISKGSSITLLNEISDQIQILMRQVEKLETAIQSRIDVLDRHISYLSPRVEKQPVLGGYVTQLKDLTKNYHESQVVLGDLNKTIGIFRSTLDRELQVELSSRQGFPSFDSKMLLDLGKEMLLVPALAFEEFKSLSMHVIKGVKATSTLGWSVFTTIQCLLLFSFFFLRQTLIGILARPSKWRNQINSRWISLQWVRRNIIDIFFFVDIVGTLFFFGVPVQHFIFIINLAMVWMIFKSIITVAKLCLVETTHSSLGHDMILYHRLKWFILAGAVITAITVFLHQLPLIYELKAMFDWLFLCLLMIVSVLLLRSWHVLPDMIVSHMESRHPYFERSVRLFGVLIPALMLANSVIGLIGYVNLIMTVSRYEGIFLLVLIGYLIVRGLLSDGMEQVSRLMIQYVSNGWLWTEAFLKPIDKVVRLALFFAAGAVLFYFYEWDGQSPVVMFLTSLLSYQIAYVFNTSITSWSLLKLFVVVSVFYWLAKWTREFVYRSLSSRTKDMGIRNSLAILSQYAVVVMGIFISLRVLGIDLGALTAIAAAFAFGVGLGLRDLANNFASGFLILLERPLRVGDIVAVNAVEGEVINIGSRAVTIRTFDHMELVVPNTEIFNKSFTNWTSKDNIVRSIVHVQISRYDNPHEVKAIIHSVLDAHTLVLKDPASEVFLKDMTDTRMDFELRYFVNIRQVKSRTAVTSSVLMTLWDEFSRHGIKPPYPQHEIFLRGGEMSPLMLAATDTQNN